MPGPGGSRSTCPNREARQPPRGSSRCRHPRGDESQPGRERRPEQGRRRARRPVRVAGLGNGKRRECAKGPDARRRSRVADEGERPQGHRRFPSCTESPPHRSHREQSSRSTPTHSRRHLSQPTHIHGKGHPSAGRSSLPMPTVRSRPALSHAQTWHPGPRHGRACSGWRSLIPSHQRDQQGPQKSDVRCIASAREVPHSAHMARVIFMVSSSQERGTSGPGTWTPGRSSSGVTPPPPRRRERSGGGPWSP